MAINTDHAFGSIPKVRDQCIEILLTVNRTIKMNPSAVGTHSPQLRRRRRRRIPSHAVKNAAEKNKNKNKMADQPKDVAPMTGGEWLLTITFSLTMMILLIYFIVRAVQKKTNEFDFIYIMLFILYASIYAVYIDVRRIARTEKLNVDDLTI